MSDFVSQSNELQEQEVASDVTLPSDKVADLVEFLVCGLVDDVQAVQLDVVDSETSTTVEIHCSEQDAGKVIGRKGRTIKAIRTLARALGHRVGTQVEVNVIG